MNRTKHCPAKWPLSRFLAVVAVLLAGWHGHAQNVQHLSVTVPGGMPGETNFITGITVASNGVTVTWDGPAGYYQLFAQQTNKPVWVAVTRRTDLLRTATLPARYSNALFRVSGPSPLYTGSQTCALCHDPILRTVQDTPHAAAFTNTLFMADGGQTNGSCLACHTVGFELTTGFVNEAKTPHLAGVQCENCHGPAANHAANPDNPAVRPRAEVASQVCGGCHTDPRHPTFDEWTNSAHALVTNLLITNFNAAHQMTVTNLNVNSTKLINACGRCHSGSVRLSLLQTNALPTGDADIGIVCSTCHDPHQATTYPAQLRNPVASTNDYFMPTNGKFAAYYKANINLCGQCHNDRGDSWSNNACEPHHSLQYNMLLGTVGEFTNGVAPYEPGSHARLITNQCVGCHMQTTPFVSDTQPANTGHDFMVQQYGLCVTCHVSVEPISFLVSFVNSGVTNDIDQLIFDLDYWAAGTTNSTNKVLASLYPKYGNLAWEYTTPGSLSSGGPGPNATEQLQIPENIRKARFNLYVVHNDGSFGVHNPEYVAELVYQTEQFIRKELDP
jgi:hypothetical protein